VAAFQETWREQRPRVIPPEHTRPVRVCRQDERRVGWLTVRRRRLTARVVLARPSRHAERFQRFVAAFAAAFADRFTSLLLENRGAHPAQRLTSPAHVRLVCFPPYGPELNPLARVWRDLKDDVAWQQFLPVDAPQDEGDQVWRAYDAPTLPSLTGDTSWVEAVHARLA
jgi:hypothetical protein